MSHLTYVLGTGLGSSARAENALNFSVLGPAPSFDPILNNISVDWNVSSSGFFFLKINTINMLVSENVFFILQ